MENQEFDLNRVDAIQDPSVTSRFSAINRAQFEVPAHPRGLDGDDIAAIEALPLGSALLIVRFGPGEGARYLLNSDQAFAGRHPKSDIFLDDVTVSRKHAIFMRHNNEFYIQDSGSLNGTYVNDELVDEAKLNNHDEVRIGKFRFTFFESVQG
ncbi:FHA domain-containing protein [Arcanobacterium hippocoleae]|uniref:PSer/pThr/pTyr-binding forkhead associated (FHA) protein n=1 Tax=Arcanobacterium hippocoleae TaxID=149017 RepID=A0ABU1T0E9_9ACTO|nr:FHA domain-containing protein [Arcanobacterium hippocoleae]MDR6938780.1 pSer/pThr/pTyr-binding forkhead associated (FHA) protein [Arcanobacterium hippocoleae]